MSTNKKSTIATKAANNLPAAATKNAICTYDFTCKAEGLTHEDIAKWLELHCKKWAFQKEKSDSGYIHYQGRFSLKVKERLQTLIPKCQAALPGVHLSPTTAENANNDFYVTKEQTRIEGPWLSTDSKAKYVPRQVREINTWRPWQQTILDLIEMWDTRHINFIYDPHGNIGKSVLCQYLRVKELAMTIPFCNDYKDIMRMVMDMPESRAYMIDLPKAIKKEKLFQLYAGIESVKGGYAFDDRYAFTWRDFDCPNIVVFSNTLPDRDLLSEDRWLIWHVVDNELVKYEL